MANNSTKLGLVDLNSGIPQWRHLVAKNGAKLGQVDLSSDVPTAEASSGQEWY